MACAKPQAIMQGNGSNAEAGPAPEVNLPIGVSPVWHELSPVAGRRLQAWATKQGSAAGGIRTDVGRAPTESAMSRERGGRGLFQRGYGSFPAASEREAKMDGPLVRLRLGGTKGTRSWRAPRLKQEPPLLFQAILATNAKTASQDSTAIP